MNVTLVGLALAGLRHGSVFVATHHNVFTISRMKLWRFESPFIYGSHLKLDMHTSHFSEFLEGIVKIEDTRFSGKYETPQLWHPRGDTSLTECIFFKCRSDVSGAFSIVVSGRHDLKVKSCSFVSCCANQTGCFTFTGGKLEVSSSCFGSCMAKTVQTFSCNTTSVSVSTCWFDQCAHRPIPGDQSIFELSAQTVSYLHNNISRSVVRGSGACGVFQAHNSIKYQYNCQSNSSGSNFLCLFLNERTSSCITNSYFRMCIPFREPFLSSVFRYSGFPVITEFVFVLTRMKTLSESVGKGAITFVKCITDYSRESVIDEGENIAGFSFESQGELTLKETDFMKWQCATSFSKTPTTPPTLAVPTDTGNHDRISKSKKLTVSRQFQLLTCFVLSVLITATLYLYLLNYRRALNRRSLRDTLRSMDADAEIGDVEMDEASI